MRGRSAFQVDIEKYYVGLYKTRKPTVSRRVRFLILNMGVHCIAVYRFGQVVKRFHAKHKVFGRALRFVYLLANYAILLVHKVELNGNSRIGAGFRISHVGNIYIGACTIGENCTLTHGVTIGQGLAEARTGVPIIGDRVWIGTGSVIAGNITIGDGVTISAGSIVTRDIPARCLVAGNPARVINRDYDNSRMLIYKMEDSSMLESDSSESRAGCRSDVSKTTGSGCVADNGQTENPG